MSILSWLAKPLFAVEKEIMSVVEPATQTASTVPSVPALVVAPPVTAPVAPRPVADIKADIDKALAVHKGHHDTLATHAAGAAVTKTAMTENASVLTKLKAELEASVASVEKDVNSAIADGESFFGKVWQKL